MIAAPVSAPPEPVITEFPIHRLTVEQYHAMIDAGIIKPEDRLELLEGWLVEKMGKNPPHAYIREQIEDWFKASVGAGWLVRSQEPLSLPDGEPEPDVMIARGVRSDYKSRHPQPGDVALLVEVSDATLHIDRKLKNRVYARAGIPFYWIANVNERLFEVYTDAFDDGTNAFYRQMTLYTEGDQLPLIIDGQEVARITVKELLP